jgi:paraquat-inducible protein A
MVDVYVVAIMIALVHFGGLSEIRAGAGANFFLLVVIVTMLAAMQFDPRLIWDLATEKNTTQKETDNA